MANICKNTISITYFENDPDKKIEIFKDICKELSPDLPMFFVEDFINPNAINVVTFSSKWVAPIELLQNICYKYNVDIIGVAYEFSDGYVESFELHNHMEEDSGNHFISLQAEDRENTETLPLDGNEDILSDDVDDIDLNMFNTL